MKLLTIFCRPKPRPIPNAPPQYDEALEVDAEHVQPDQKSGQNQAVMNQFADGVCRAAIHVVARIHLRFQNGPERNHESDLER